METTETYSGASEVGEYIAVDSQVGDIVTVTCEEDEFSAEVVNTPNTVPESEQTTVTVTCEDNLSDDVYELYARVTEIGEMHTEYDVYALHVFLQDDEELGEITEITVRVK